MRATLITLLISITVFAKAQRGFQLELVPQFSKPTRGLAIIYGQFNKRLNVNSGGLMQEIIVLNHTTEKKHAFVVKSMFKSSLSDKFLYYIKPGKYSIISYWYNESKLYGSKATTEPIFKEMDTTIEEFKENVRSGKIKIEDLQQFTFEVEPATLTYLGTWHFETGLVSFTNEKSELDQILSPRYTRIDFSTAKTSIPN